MLFNKSFLAIAAAVGPAIAHFPSQPQTKAPSAVGGLNLYWGQYGDPSDRLASYCDAPGVTFVSLSFVTYSPKNSGGYPGTNFAGHCGGEVFYKNPKTGEDTKSITNCEYIKQDIKHCQTKGIKVLLAIGGWCPAEGPCSYDIDTDEQGQEFGELLHKTFGPHDPNWTGPRPFDISSTEHVSVDGFDFDLEFKYPNQKPWIKMVEKLRSVGIYHISAAPQCPTSDTWFQLKELIYNAQFDSLFIQFYNNPGCQVSDTPNYDDWETVISQTSKSKDAKLYLGVLAHPDAGWNGYVSPSKIKELICKYKSKPHFGGVSIWDATRGVMNQVNGQAFHEAVADALQYGCDPIPPKTSTTVVSTSTSTSSLVSSTTTSLSTTSSAVVSTTSSAVVSTTSSTSFSSSSDSPSSSHYASASASSLSSDPVSLSATATAAATASASTTASASASSPASVSASTSASASHSVSDSASAGASATASASGSVSAPGSASASASASGSATHSDTITSLSSSASASASATKSATASDTCEEDDEDFPTITLSNSHSATGAVTSSITGFANVTKTATDSASVTGSGSVTGSAAGPATSSITGSATGSASVTESAKNTLTSSEELVTSTVYTTKVTTVTSCKPEVPCTKGQVVTETVPWYTTVCPATATSSAAAVPTTTAPPPPPQWTTSTVYTTKTYTITSCAPDVPYCPVGQITTKVVAAYTTVCPYTSTTPGGGGGGGKPSGDAHTPPKPSADVPHPPRPTGEVPKPPSPFSQAGEKPSGDVPHPPKPTGEVSKPPVSNGGNKPVYTTLTVPVTVGKYNTTIPGTGASYEPTPTGGFPSYTTAAPIPSKPVEAGAGKMGGFGVAGLAAVAAALLL
ncbi:glycoside hydrolase [Colletotrichum somersetense]|nr:glycoside hydrolase [Colletotrichum somersetense]